MRPEDSGNVGEAMTSDVGEGLGPRNRIDEAARQAVLDAAALLQVRRSQVAAALSRGEDVEAQVMARGIDGTNDWMMRAAYDWRELCSVRPAATVAQLRVSLPNNRALLERGLRMVSLFDYDRLDRGARLLLAGEGSECYRFAFATVQMKIVDRRTVLLQGPFVDGEPTVMAVQSPACLAAARGYWEAVVASSFSTSEEPGQVDGLTPRQQQIVAMLATDARDEVVAATLGVSVRTVRSDIAALMEALGVRSRFSAGLRLQQVADTEE
ncbi:hypothetical protein GCM10027600_14780 [Nocardioides ginsengisegetis]